MIAVEKIAEEIADSIRAVYASGAIPSHALLVYKFTDVYERL
jgi:hypothetical protein